jgi:predicted metalloprotease with PDZ domain
MNGGSRLGAMLDSLMKNRQLPNVEKAFKYYSLKMINDVKKGDDKESKDDAWLGITVKDSMGKLVVTSHQTDSPLRELLMPGDEIIAINGRRTDSKSKLNSSLKGQKGKQANVIYNHEGVVKSVDLLMVEKVHHKVKIDGKGNQKWRNYISTRQG